jgi:uncharacterized protein (DUF1330 family)
VVAIRFPTGEAFRAFFDSPGNQAVVGKRLSSTDGFAVLIDVQQPQREAADLSPRSGC